MPINFYPQRQHVRKHEQTLSPLPPSLPPFPRAPPPLDSRSNHGEINFAALISIGRYNARRCIGFNCRSHNFSSAGKRIPPVASRLVIKIPDAPITHVVLRRWLLSRLTGVLARFIISCNESLRLFSRSLSLSPSSSSRCVPRISKGRPGLVKTGRGREEKRLPRNDRDKI